ncbi:hypothetical protein SAMN05216251_107164 [Actinacidiphila alni]|uniref:DUF732 domain-containing protein n=1 Tax=Actinacidiphila alni TaxID=380248 RepID=A0A1I2F6U7_9ACTN|nr:hypothetical protein [Actinacidiphila alni]SFF00261.1 hypothetical protein SAMN05216251_107164 [Actinacidiphila alni]
MIRIHRRAAAAVLVTAAAVLLSGCGGGGHDTAADGKSKDKATATVSAPSAGGTAPAPSASSTGAQDPGTTEAPGSAADAPKVPDAQLTPPGGGTFTAEQKTYLSGRVPKGTDPVAVLEGGQEICDRLTRTAATDKDAAATAIVTGDITMAGAEAAVDSLCPDLKPVITAASRGFADGTFTVAATAVAGKSVAPGHYRAPHPSPNCTWRVTGKGGGVLDSGSSGSPGGARLTVPAGARGVTSSGCYAWLAG